MRQLMCSGGTEHGECRICYKPEANAEERPIATLDDASDGSPDAEVSAADITSRVGEIFQEFATNVRKFRAKLVPWLLFSASSRPLFFMFSFCFLFPFLLKILTTPACHQTRRVLLRFKLYSPFAMLPPDDVHRPSCSEVIKEIFG